MAGGHQAHLGELAGQLLSGGVEVVDDDGVEMPEVCREWPIMKRLCTEGRLAADAVPDAWIAAAVIATGGHLVTFDRGFRRLLGRGQLTLLSGTS